MPGAEVRIGIIGAGANTRAMHVHGLRGARTSAVSEAVSREPSSDYPPVRRFCLRWTEGMSAASTRAGTKVAVFSRKGSRSEAAERTPPM